MKIIKFAVNEDYYSDMITMCSMDDTTVKMKLGVLLSNDTDDVVDIKEFFPPDYNDKLRTVTLKINENLYDGITKKADQLAVKPSTYVKYLIYRFLANK
ncbi:MAG: hypothetical protein PF505_11245 [Vallitaleaceae bacterium]|jgi:hypothetical protein|nr:hypothetical protein [Vallitaleaceae bacterium]